MPLLSVVVPLYNEKNYVRQIIQKVLDEPTDKEVIIVDDCSTDGSWEIVQEIEGVRVIRHERNRGKGAALRTGFQHVTGEIVIVQDADMEYDPRDYQRILQPIKEGWGDVVYGSRFLGGPHRVMFFWHYLGNRFLTMFSNMLNNLNLTDMETCYKCFRRDALDGITIRSDRFGFEPEITAKFARKKLRIYEAPIAYYGRGFEEGKKIHWTDGITAMWCIFKYRFFD